MAKKKRESKSNERLAQTILEQNQPKSVEVMQQVPSGV